MPDRTAQKQWLLKIIDGLCPYCTAYKKQKGVQQKCPIFKAVHNVEPMLYDNARKFFDLEARICKGFKERKS